MWHRFCRHLVYGALPQHLQGFVQIADKQCIVLLLIGYIMLTRLNFNLAVKQFIFATVGLIITAFIPYIMLKWKKMKDCGVLYGVIGLLFLLTVFIPGLGSEKYGSRNWINLGHLSVQPMEFVKILFVFFVASMLVKASTFKELL